MNRAGAIDSEKHSLGQIASRLHKKPDSSEGALGKVPSGNSPAVYPTAEAAILERHKQAAVGEELNAKAAMEIEELLEETERVREKRQIRNGGWCLSTPMVGARYYTF